MSEEYSQHTTGAQSSFDPFGMSAAVSTLCLDRELQELSGGCTDYLFPQPKGWG
jgi:hypothetical protein